MGCFRPTGTPAAIIYRIIHIQIKVAGGRRAAALGPGGASGTAYVASKMPGGETAPKRVLTFFLPYQPNIPARRGRPRTSLTASMSYYQSPVALFIASELTDPERQYLHKRIAEEHSQLERLEKSRAEQQAYSRWSERR